MDDNDWEVGFTNNDEEHLYEVVVELWQVGELYPNELNFLPYVFYGKMQPLKCLVIEYGLIIMNQKKY